MLLDNPIAIRLATDVMENEVAFIDLYWLMEWCTKFVLKVSDGEVSSCRIYIPPFTMTDEITNFVIEIAELTGAMTVLEQLSKNPKLRRENRIKSIQSSLAIEQNSLTLEQVSDIIDGKRVLGPPQDIREVQNTYEAYELMTKFNPYSIKDLLRAHKIMMDGLVKEAGIFRSKGVGVYAGENLIHAGTPANYVPDLVGQLFDWLKRSKLHPLVKSCIFHYEFEFIHPFADGKHSIGQMILKSKYQTKQKIKASDIFLFQIFLKI